MFLLKSLSLCCLGNSADFHTAERGAAQNLSAWFAPREARTPSRRPGGNLRGHSPLVSLQSLQPQNPMTGTYLTQLPFSLLTDLPPPPLRQGESNPYCYELWLTEALAQTTAAQAKNWISAAVNDPRPARTVCCSRTCRNISFHFVTNILRR